MTFPLIDIVAAMDHPAIFRPWFDGESWNGWRTVLKAAFALPLTLEEITFFKSIAGNREPPKRRVRELWCVCGRRAGKDSIASLIAAHAAASFDPTEFLRRGERALVGCVAPDRETGKIVQRYVDSYFDGIPPLSTMKRRTVNSDGLVELVNAVDIAVMSNDFRLTRGRPILCGVLDECAFMRSETSSKPDTELYNALLPGMATIPQAMLIGISSPRGKAGLLYKKWREYFGVDDDDILVIQAPSHVLNPTLDTRDRDRQMLEDPSAARAEWYAEWRDDLVAFVDPVTVDRAVVTGLTELAPMPGITYVAAVDPSGGSSDSMTLAIAHADGERGILDLVREWVPPFSPEQVTREIADICKRYGVQTVVGDRYGGEWPRERFRVHGITYEIAAMSRSDAYLTLLPALNTSGKIELLDNRRLVSQLCGLERRVARSGKDSVDHPPSAHDDVVNAAALALVKAALATMSVADEWGAFCERELEKFENGDVLPLDTDVDSVRADSGHGWKFHTPSDWLQIKIPPGPLAQEGRVFVAGQMFQASRRLGDDVFVDLLRDHAREILQRPAFAAVNRELCKELGIMEAAT